MKKLIAILLVPAILALSTVRSEETVSANAFHEYCGRCHALPDVRAVEPPDVMYNYVRAFGAVDTEIAEIRAYVEELRRGITD